MKLQLVRHATLVVRAAGKSAIVDPMLGSPGENPPVANSPNQRPNPLVPLPEGALDLAGLDAVIVTHTHRDHFDEAAARLLPKHLPVFCQPEDAEKLKQAGFADVRPVDASLVWEGITLTRTGGRHGTGEIGARMAPVSGFVLEAAGEPVLYIAGDTIWCEEVADALARFRPDVTVVNAGGARFLTGDPITMTADDVAHVCRHAPFTNVVAVHMDAINHCLVTRSELREEMKRRGLSHQVHIPSDGEWLAWEK